MESESPLVYFVPDPDNQTLKLIQTDDLGQFELELKENVVLTHDTNKYIFKLPSES